MGVQVRFSLLLPSSSLKLFLLCRPDRWDNLPDAARVQPGLYSNLMSFSVGPRVSSIIHSIIRCTSHSISVQSCIGMRFAIIEIKILIYTLVTNFSFHDTGADVIKANVCVVFLFHFL